MAVWMHYDNSTRSKSYLVLNAKSFKEANKTMVKAKPDWRGDIIYAYGAKMDNPEGKVKYYNNFPWDDYPEEVEGEVETDETSEVTDKKPDKGTEEIDEEYAKLIIISEEFFRQEFHLTKEVTTIGQEIGNDIVITDDSISRAHAVIYQQAGSFTIEDQESLSGIDVNGIRITDPTTIKHGDIIRIGAIHFQFVEKDQVYTIKQWEEI